jgi:hypothetical protein
MTSRHPGRKVGIDPIEGVLGREVVGLNRRAVDRLWLRDMLGTLSGVSGAALGGGSLGVESRSDRGRQTLRGKGRLPQPKGAGSWRRGESPSQPTQPQKKLSRRKTASFSRRKAARTAGTDRKTDGVR